MHVLIEPPCASFAHRLPRYAVLYGHALASFTTRTTHDKNAPHVSPSRPTCVVKASPSPNPGTIDNSRVLSEVTRRIKELGRQGKAKEAIGELASVARLGVQPDTQSATALLDACMRNNKIDMAESVFEELFGGELLTPDEVSFAVMLRGYGAQDPPRWTAISNTLATMERDYGLTPTTLTFNALLEICSRTNDEVRGTELIQRMATAQVLPDDFTLEAVRQRKSLRSLLKKAFDL